MKAVILVRYFCGYLLFHVSWAKTKGLSSITHEDINSALIKALQEVKVTRDIEYYLLKQGKFIDLSVVSTFGRHQVSSCAIETCPKLDKYILEHAAVHIVKKYELTAKEVKGLARLFLRNDLVKNLRGQCLDNRPVKCVDSKYRTIDGSCNNLERPNEGRSFSCHSRLLPPVYADGVKEPRISVTGKPLPHPRLVTITLNREICSIGRPTSNFLMVFGQFIDHDTVLTKQTSLADNAPFFCCPLGTNPHEQCLPLWISPNDLDFPNITCMNFARDIPCDPCSSVREHLNAKTPMLDCSQVYGAIDEDATFLRTFKGDGKLRVTTIKGAGDVPPPMRNPYNDQCSIRSEGFICPITGDIRSNQHPLLLTIHTLFLRYHNFIVEHLRALNPHWDEETLYQEGRRILAAMFQNMAYCHYLPRVIGSREAKRFELCTDETKYDSRRRLALFNSIPTTVFRFSHSTIPDDYLLVSETGKLSVINLKDVYFDPRPIYGGLLEDIIRGSTAQRQEEFDRCLSKAVTQFLYHKEMTALDLQTINIHRGREHGQPGYTAFFEHVSGKRIDSFQDLPFDPSCIKKVTQLYSSVEDIDLFVGILCELKLEDAMVGPVSASVVGQQFNNLKFGDRYFHTHVGETGSFTSEQRKAIRQTTMSTVVCAVTKITNIAKDMFDTKSPEVPCELIPKLNFAPWKEKPL